MNRKENVCVTAQSHFGLWNETSEELYFNPPIYMRYVSGEYFPSFSITGITFGGIRTTHISENEYGALATHIEAPLTFTMRSASIVCAFSIVKNGNDLLFKPLTPNAEVLPNTVLYDDVSGGLSLRVFDPSRPIVANEAHQNVQQNVYQNLGFNWPPRGAVTGKGTPSKVIPDNEPFSFLYNVNIYFTGSIYRRNGQDWQKITNMTNLGFGAWGSYCSLTGDDTNLYPAGISTLEIKDGFSEGSATIQFDHNMADRTVTISVLSHTSKICDIRDLTELEVPFNFPNTICFAL